MSAQIGGPAPLLEVSQWVQGDATNLDRLKGRVVLVEVFQVNCPGCFLYAIPQAIDLHWHYADHGLTVLGLATAFEDFEKNTLENLKLLLQTGEVVGETLKGLGRHGQLAGNRLTYRIPFPVAMDRLTKITVGDNIDISVMNAIHAHVPDFDARSEPEKRRIYQRIEAYLRAKSWSAATFDAYGLQGTPSQILVDRQGILREVIFGRDDSLDDKVSALLSDY